jgi:hypothetical protein
LHLLTTAIGTELATRALQHFRQESKGHLTLDGRGPLRIVLGSATLSISSASDADLPPMHEVAPMRDQRDLDSPKAARRQACA